jgi:putative transposase
MVMARQLRIEYPGAFYHVMARGNAQQDIFIDDGDRRAFLALISQAHERHAFEVHAYVLMSNHYHLLLRTPRGEISNGMRDINARYSQCFNRRWSRVGHLFQGRFKALIIDSDRYLLTLNRYIHQNPVAAGLANHAWAYAWSSCPAFVGEAIAPVWLNLSMVLERFRSVKDYKGFLDEKMEVDPIRASIGQTVLGSEDFLEGMRSKARELLVSRKGIANRLDLVGQPPMASIEAAVPSLLERLKIDGARGRPISRAGVTAYLLREYAGYPIVDIARRLSLTNSAVMNAICRFRMRLASDDKAKSEVDKLRASWDYPREERL